MTQSAQTPAPAPTTQRMLLGIKEPGKPGRIVVWDTEEISLGRSPENDIVVDDSDASRRHALFHRTASGCRLQDLGTSNGTRVNGVPIHDVHELVNKDVVRIGDVEITFIATRKDPGALGLEVVYASELKSFSGAAAAVADPGATTLGLTDVAPGRFDVGAVGDFGFDGPGAAPPPAPVEAEARDLDLEFAEFGPPQPAAADAPGRLSLKLEIEGASPDLRRVLESLNGKVIELSALRIRFESDPE